MFLNKFLKNDTVKTLIESFLFKLFFVSTTIIIFVHFFFELNRTADFAIKIYFILIILYFCYIALKTINHNEYVTKYTPHLLLSLLIFSLLNSLFRILSEETTLVCYSLTTLVAIFCFWINRKNFNYISYDEKKNRSFLFILGIIFIVGMTARIATLNQDNPSVWVDEAISIFIAERINGDLGQTFYDQTIYNRAYIYQHYLATAIEDRQDKVFYGQLQTYYFL